MRTRTAALTPDPYLPWAPHYDWFSEHPTYPGWVRRLEALSQRARAPGDEALDIGCGTGKSTEPLVELGYRVTACDQSQEMLALARAKLERQDVRFAAARLPELPRLGSFEYVSCVNDVVNYLLEPEELTAALRRIADNLAPDGVLVFDTSTAALYRTCYAELRWREIPGAAVLWRGETSTEFEPGGIAMAAVEVFTEVDGCWRRETCRHVQRHHTEAAVAEAVAAAGLCLDSVWGQYDDGYPEQPLNEQHTKVIHVVTKP